jgi:hypothetical protein
MRKRKFKVKVISMREEGAKEEPVEMKLLILFAFVSWVIDL